MTANPLKALGAELVEMIVVDVTVVPSVVGDYRIIIVKTDTRFAPGGLVVTPFGFGSVSVDGNHLLFSEDGIEWFAAPSPFTFPLVRPGGAFGDEDIGYTVRTLDKVGDATWWWHSVDYIEWVPIDPSSTSLTYHLRSGTRLKCCHLRGVSTKIRLMGQSRSDRR